MTEQILARRAAAAKLDKAASPKGAVPPAGTVPAEDPAVAEARTRLADVDTRIEASRRRSVALAEPREKLTARNEELDAEAARIGESNRARVEALYRSAKLGAGAAGWHPDEARSLRLTRYLAAVAAVQQEALARVEVEQGSVIAALDRARTEDVGAANERRVLDAERVEAQAALDRAMELSTGGPAAEQPAEVADDGAAEIPDVDRAMAEAAAKLAAASAPPALAKPVDDGFRWPGAEPLPLSPSEGAGVTAPPESLLSAVTPAPAPAPASSVDGEADDETPDELEDGPAVLAPSDDSEAPAPTEGAGPTRPQGFLQRLFDDGESDRFASARGKLPVPVPGKVVAGYGQQHKSGGTYRGVILRATHGAPVRAVAEGRVSFVGTVPGLGNTVIVSHGSRYHTVYARLGKLRVKEGDRVDGGMRVGELPDNDSDMHFELRDQGKAVDPVPWMKPGVPGAAR